MEGYVGTYEQTSTQKIVNCLKLCPVDHFRWNNDQFLNIASSGAFSNILDCQPAKMEDGTIQMQIIVYVPPFRNVEYDISTSLYTGSWKGDLDFSWSGCDERYEG